MTFLSALYTLIISPLELLFEIIFTIANKIIGNGGYIAPQDLITRAEAAANAVNYQPAKIA